MTKKDEWESRSANWRFLRDILLFLGGLTGVMYETVFQNPADPTLLLLFGAMMGLPAFLNDDQDKDD